MEDERPEAGGRGGNWPHADGAQKTSGGFGCPLAEESDSGGGVGGGGGRRDIVCRPSAAAT